MRYLVKAQLLIGLLGIILAFPLLVFGAQTCTIKIDNKSSHQFTGGVEQVVYRGSLTFTSRAFPVVAKVTGDSKNFAWGRIEFPLASNNKQGGVFAYQVFNQNEPCEIGSSWGNYGYKNPSKTLPLICIRQLKTLTPSQLRFEIIDLEGDGCP